MEVIAVIAGLVLIWMAWQLHRARQFNLFRKRISQELKPQIVDHIRTHLADTRSELLPNSEIHIEATTQYWCQYHVRILQYALEHDIISKEWLIETGNYRHCQHLFHIEKHLMH